MQTVKGLSLRVMGIVVHGWDLGQEFMAPFPHTHPRSAGPKVGLAGHGLQNPSGKCDCGDAPPRPRRPQRMLLSPRKVSFPSPLVRTALPTPPLGCITELNAGTGVGTLL